MKARINLVGSVANVALCDKAMRRLSHDEPLALTHYNSRMTPMLGLKDIVNLASHLQSMKNGVASAMSPAAFRNFMKTPIQRRFPRCLRV
ncbi:MAG: hypothetical protein POH28_07000 [Acidocella sp.]|nr:hypothetical protein [Acidocella sp.]